MGTLFKSEADPQLYMAFRRHKPGDLPQRIFNTFVE